MAFLPPPPSPPAQQDNPLLSFLRPEHTLHRYFEYVLQRVKKGLPVGAWECPQGSRLGLLVLGIVGVVAYLVCPWRQ
jgi:hypothetical protein